MNEFLRIFKRTFKLFGYDLKKAGKLTLVPLHNQPDPHLKVVYDAFDREPKRGDAVGSDLDKLVVYIRTCLRSNRNVDTTPRFTGASTAETVYRCLRSTIRSINEAHGAEKENQLEVVILDDHSDAPYLLKIKELCQEIQCPWTLKTTREKGQGKSLLEQFELAKSLNALCYFCEDDYLHEPSAIQEMWQFYRQMVAQTGNHLVLHPQECEFLYQTHYPSYIIAGEKHHWRTMNHATHVLWTHSHVVRSYWRYFENTKYVGDRKKRQWGAESKTTNLLFRHIPGFCPVPAVAGHAQFKLSLPPCFDWQKIWEENAC
ncbi:MAG: rhamnosyltransferase [Alphaproteobacteria bacterium]|jgi:hypothetical protein|nr:rhamnosyltransferase [Alphaproteobacteria bacterium]